MLKKYQGFNVIFAIIFAVQLLSDSDTMKHVLFFPYIHFIIKPLITISLLSLLAYQTGFRGRFAKRIGFGLFLGLVGDVCLMFEDLYSPLFMIGLGAFLIGHLSYMSAFYLDYRVNKGVYQNIRKNAILAYIFYVIIFCGLLWTHLGDFRIPVILYAIAISFMGVMAVSRYGRVNSFSFKAIFYGSLLFVLSDTILAVDRFFIDFRASSILVMATYMAAQYLITMGNLERKMKKRVEEI